MSEFAIISHFFEPLGFTTEYVRIEIGDDAAILTIPDDYDLVTAGDTLVSEVHFPEDFSAYDIAYRSLATNISDISAMGAKPIGYLLQISMANNNPIWLEGFCEGLKDAAQGIPLIGGDTTKAKQTIISITTYGIVKKQQALLRSRACVGDNIYVTGVLGQGALGLSDYQSGLTTSDAAQHFTNPIIYRTFSEKLSTLANACIDISDGLDGDLAHILDSSWVGANIYLENLPLVMTENIKQAWQFALYGGDDYQLCFTAPKEKADAIELLAKDEKAPITLIGEIIKGSKINYFYNNEKIEMSGQSYQHFTDKADDNDRLEDL